ncbi:hypothetical protein NEF87_001011 [Candidatus Lokiarchaeum ossiferum]|uniref:Uncharacterized protein n=1 Tax=Candidatus Lokiarchaeum ossiferum TaxID=2951803 RepID=A0ABY6HMJ0_9ARCH|nr:hypothetical protein NEF87_001011 [Candidatus Lokiarchaeum sp. B-35]
MARKRTRTKDFGVSKRESHDSSAFYASRLYETINFSSKHDIVENSKEFLRLNINPMQKHSYSNLINKIPPSSIHLVILEVNLGMIESTESLNLKLEKYSERIHELNKKLITGGRIVIIVCNIIKIDEKSPFYVPLHARITKFLLKQHFFLRGNIVLVEEQGIMEQSTDPISNKYKIAIIASKERMKREKKNKNRNFEKTDTISRDEFLSATKSIWYPNLPKFEKLENEKSISCELEYYKQLIQLYSFQEDVVLILKNDIWDNFLRSCHKIRKNCFCFNQ